MVTVMYKTLIWLLFIIYEESGDFCMYRALKFVAWHNGVLHLNLSLPFQVSKIMMVMVVMSFLWIKLSQND
jgi:hypothetical protein